MTLRQKDIDFIKDNLSTWLEELSLIAPARDQRDLVERIDAIDDALEQHRRLLKAQNEQLEKRFSSVQQAIERQQEGIEARLTNIRDEIELRLTRLDRRIEAVDKRTQTQEQRFQQLPEQLQEELKIINRRVGRSVLWTFLISLFIGALVVGSLVFLLSGTLI